MQYLTLTLSIVLSSLVLPLFGQNTQAASNHKISVEIDPATFAFGGYGLHLRLQPKASEHLLLGFGTYAMNMPKALVDLNPANRNLGWNVRLQQGHGLFAEYHFSMVNKGLFSGLQTSFQQYRIEHTTHEGSETFSSLLGMAFIGYSWQPFDDHFYLKPWTGIGYVNQVSGHTQLASSEYDVAPITYFATLHLGYTF